MCWAPPLNVWAQPSVGLAKFTYGCDPGTLMACQCAPPSTVRYENPAYAKPCWASKKCRYGRSPLALPTYCLYQCAAPSVVWTTKNLVVSALYSTTSAQPSEGV